MAHHKRGKRKNLRAGCRLCKPHKANGTKGTKDAQTFQELKARLAEKEQRHALRGQEKWSRYDDSTSG